MAASLLHPRPGHVPVSWKCGCKRLNIAFKAQSKPSSSSPKAHIYLVKMPLVGLEATDSLPEPLSSAAALHLAVVVSSSSTDGSWLFDFLPEDATNPLILARLLSGDSVPAVARVRQLQSLPRLGCSLVGVSPLEGDAAVTRAVKFQNEWEHELQLFKLDCRDHTRELVAVLLSG